MKTMRKGLRVAFIGTGMAAEIHSKVLRRHFPGVHRSYISRSTERADRLAARYGGTTIVGGWQTALADPSLDAVFVTTPPDTHLELTLEALAAGKSVVVEKPAYLDSGDFDVVERAARDRGGQVLVAENYFYKPLLRRLRRIIASGELGRVRLVELNAVKAQDASGWRSDPALAGGGALFEGGIHWVSFLANLGLSVDRVEGHFPDAPAGHERSVVLVAEFAEGAVGVLNYSWEIPSKLRGLRLSRIWGTNGSVLFESNGLFAVRSGPRLPGIHTGLRDITGRRAMMVDFVRSLSTGDPPQFTLDAAKRDVELVRAAYAGAGK